MGRRTRIADWSAGVLAVLVLVLGSLVVLKPAIDNWSDLYSGDPFATGTTTQTVKKSRPGAAAETTTTTTEEASASPVERVLGRSGLVLVRLVLVAIAAFFAAAVLRWAILGKFSARIGAAQVPALAATGGNSSGEAATSVKQPAITEVRNGLNALAEPEDGEGTIAEPASGNMAWVVATLVASRRDALGLSQRELARRAGISHTVISRIESGQHAPSAKTVERLADALR
jgi:HTH-type transcriptional regulator / antitoxin HipB